MNGTPDKQAIAVARQRFIVETAARKLAVLRGYNPDEVRNVSVPSENQPSGITDAAYKTQNVFIWQLFVNEVMAHLQMMEAIAATMQEVQQQVKAEKPRIIVPGRH